MNEWQQKPRLEDWPLLVGEDEATYFLASIVRTLKDSVVTIDLHGIITSWNAAAEKLYGHSAKEALGKSLQMLTLPGDFDTLMDKIRAFQDGKDFPLYDTIRVRKDNQLIHLDIMLSPVINGQGKLIGLSTLARDVSEIRKTQDILRSSESHLRAIFEAATDFAIITLNQEGHITEWNKGSELMFGYTREEIIGQHTAILFTPEDRQGMISQVEIDLARETGRSIDERWHAHKDGSRFFMSGVMTMITGIPNGGFVKVARNITDRKLAEEALMLSEQRTSMAVESAGMGEWEWSLVDNNVRLNEQAKKVIGVLGKGEDYLMNMLLGRVLPADVDHVQKALKAALDGLYIFQAEYRIVREDNQQVIWVNAYGRVVAHVDERPSRMIGVVYDVTARKSLEKQKDDFISVASHELRTPVTSIKLYGELLEGSLLEAGDHENLDLLRNLNGQVNRLITLLQTLLDTNTLTEGKMRLNPERINLNELILEQFQLLHPVAAKHRLEKDLGPVPDVHADPERIAQVITNLVSNAVKYSPAGTRITVKTEDKLSAVLVTVQDEGPGIPSDVQALLFERYYRVLNESNKGRDGFGLGLYICSEIIRHHHGDIGLHSTLGQGSSFYFTIPYT